MGSLEAVKKQAICGRAIDNEPPPMKGCNYVDCETCKVRHKVPQYYAESVVLPFIADLKEKNKKLKGFKEIAQILLDQNEGLEVRLDKIQKLCHVIPRTQADWVKQQTKILGLVGEEQ